MKKKTTKYYILLLLIVMFAAPGVTAYLFYQHPNWVGSGKVNKGMLLRPPIVLKSLDAQPKWRIVFWSPNVCDKACLQQLDTLARIRLALGRKLYQVDQWLVLGAHASPLTPEAQSLLKELDFHVAHMSAVQIDGQTPLPLEAVVFIANPDNYLILRYQSQVNPEDVYKDLKLLLNITEGKNG